MNNPYIDILLQAKQTYEENHLTMGKYVHMDKDTYQGVLKFCGDLPVMEIVSGVNKIFGMDITVHPEYEFGTCIVTSKEIK